MQFTDGAQVFAESGEALGRITHVVLDPIQKAVTHIVVRQGFLFAEDKVIPANLFITANPDEVILRAHASQLKRLPPLSQPHYVAVERPRTVAADLLGMNTGWSLEYSAEQVPNEPGWIEIQFVEQEKQNIPHATVALECGARVISADQQHVGNVESVLTRAGTDNVSHMVMVGGLLAKVRRIVPASWFQFIEADVVYLSVNHARLETLPEY